MLNGQLWLVICQVCIIRLNGEWFIVNGGLSMVRGEW